MADKENAQQPAAAPAVVMMSPAQHAAREIARQQQEMAESGVKLDEAKVPGGYYLGADGQPHDANGNPIKGKAAAKAEADAEEDEAEEQAASRPRSRGKK